MLPFSMKKALVLFLTFIVSSASFSQIRNEIDTMPPTLFWLSAGIGVGGQGIQLIGRTTFGWDYSNIFIQASTSGTLAVGGGSGGIYLDECGVYYGRHKFNDFSILKVAGGLDYLVTHEYGVPKKSIGLGLQAEAFLKAGPLGLGILFMTIFSPIYS
jgi:hypothetical protein